jgi:hypothetical protein
MVLQTANIISGFLLAAPTLAGFGAKEQVEKMHNVLLPFQSTIGIIELVLGILALIERMGIVWLHIPNFGSSYPQAIPAILVGLLLSAKFFESVPSVKEQIAKLAPYGGWIGIAAFASGLNSLLFGCWLCVYY